VLLEGDKQFRGVIPFLERLQQKAYKAANRFIVKRYQVPRRCGDCAGTRLRPEALRVRVGGKDIAALCALPVGETAAFLDALTFTPSQQAVAGVALTELRARLAFLLRVDLGYLTLDRLTRTLSAARRSGSNWPTRSAPTSPTRSTCSTSQRPDCIRATPSASSASCTSSPRARTRWSWSSMTRS
jgi:excinuclease ABC subunit A